MVGFLPGSGCICTEGVSGPHRGCGPASGIAQNACPSLLVHSRHLVVTDQRLLAVLVRFSRVLTGRYDVSDVLYELSDAVAQVLGAAGAGVSLGDDQGRLRFATATNETITLVENLQQDSRLGTLSHCLQHQ